MLDTINRRSFLTLAGAIGANAVLNPTISQALPTAPTLLQNPFSPSAIVPERTFNLSSEVKSEVLANLQSGQLRLSQKQAESVRLQDIIEFVDTGISPRGLIRGASKEESIIRPLVRPVLLVQKGSFDTRGLQVETIRQQLEDCRGRLEQAIPAIGRIELKDHPNRSWAGTGWLVAKDILVTNKHVAELFARRDGDTFSFRLGIGRRPVKASIDFIEEYAPLGTIESEFRMMKVLHIEPEDGYDLALIQIKSSNDFDGELPPPINLYTGMVASGRPIAVIGYPAFDSQISDIQAMEQIYRGVYDVKRIAPGAIMSVTTGEIQHDCTTLGGNSGSALIDMETGKAIGVHWGGTYMTANYAIPSAVIANRLQSFTS